MNFTTRNMTDWKHLYDTQYDLKCPSCWLLRCIPLQSDAQSTDLSIWPVYPGRLLNPWLASSAPACLLHVPQSCPSSLRVWKPSPPLKHQQSGFFVRTHVWQQPGVKAKTSWFWNLLRRLQPFCSRCCKTTPILRIWSAEYVGLPFTRTLARRKHTIICLKYRSLPRFEWFVKTPCRSRRFHDYFWIFDHLDRSDSILPMISVTKPYKW